MAKCTECGAAVADDSKFCNYCGAKLNIIGEHLGTRILGNTQVIMGALERIAPGAAQQYTVLGTAGDGPLAGGLILSQPQDGGYRLLWSDGDKLTEISSQHVLDCYARGAFEFSADLLDTCKDCLTVFHRTRRVSCVPGQDRMLRTVGLQQAQQCRSLDDALACLDLVAWASPGGYLCPICTARSLSLAEQIPFRIDLLAKEFGMRGMPLERCAELYDSFGGWGRQGKEYRDIARTFRYVADSFRRLAGVLDRCVTNAHDSLGAFASALPDMTIPAGSLAEWWQYQLPFARTSLWWTTDLALEGWNDTVHLDFPVTATMESDPEAAELLRYLREIPPHLKRTNR